MESEKESEEDKEETFIDKKNSIRIGEVFVESWDLSTLRLMRLVLSLLKEKEIKEYLDLIEKKKLLKCGYVG